jgi:hypothetical protein
MCVPVVQVRKVRMSIRHRRVPVRMDMRLTPRIIGPAHVPVVLSWLGVPSSLCGCGQAERFLPDRRYRMTRLRTNASRVSNGGRSSKPPQNQKPDERDDSQLTERHPPADGTVAADEVEGKADAEWT